MFSRTVSHKKICLGKLFFLALVSILPCPLTGFAGKSAKPDWMNKVSYRDASYSYFVGVATNKPSEEDARRFAWENGMRELIQTVFGGNYSVDTKTFQSTRETTLSEDNSFKSDAIDTRDIESTDIVLERMNDKSYSCWRLLRISKANGEKEKKRLLAIAKNKNQQQVANVMNSVLGTKLGDRSTIGSLEVFTDPPNAQILMDSEPVGYSNTLFTKIWAGKYTLSIHKANYEFFKRELVIAGGVTQTLKINLKRLNGKLRVHSNPDGSEVFVNGRLFGITPLLKDLPTDSYKLRLECYGYYPAETEISIDAHHLTDESIFLEPKPVKVTVLSNPESASVYKKDASADEKVYLGKTPIYNKNMLPGRYTLSYTLNGYENKNMDLTVEPGRNMTTQSVNLKHVRPKKQKIDLPDKDNKNVTPFNEEIFSDNKKAAPPSFNVVEPFGFSRMDGKFYVASIMGGGLFGLFYAIRAVEIYDTTHSATDAAAENNKNAAENATVLANISLAAAISTLVIAIPISFYYAGENKPYELSVISQFQVGGANGGPPPRAVYEHGGGNYSQDPPETKGNQLFLQLDPIHHNYGVSYAF